MMSLSTNSSARNNSRYPFTASQWQELEHQALIFKYMVSGMPIPPDLLFTIKRSMDSNKLILHQPQHSKSPFTLFFSINKHTHTSVLSFFGKIRTLDFS